MFTFLFLLMLIVPTIFEWARVTDDWCHSRRTNWMVVILNILCGWVCVCFLFGGIWIIQIAVTHLQDTHYHIW